MIATRNPYTRCEQDAVLVNARASVIGVLPGVLEERVGGARTASQR